MRESYEALIGKVHQKTGDFEFQVKLRGRYLMAEAYYLGTHARMQVGDRVMVIGTRGESILIAPAHVCAFISQH